MKKLILLFICFAGLLQAEKKHTLSICALFKNESPYLKEWIEYHKLIGVDHFYLYNNGSWDGFKKALQPYIKAKLVTLIQWPDFTGPLMNNDDIWALSTQVAAYENAAKWKAVKETKWLLFLEVDEFLVPCQEGKITDLLKKYDSYPGVILASEHYNASARGVLPPRRLVIETTEITAAPKPILQRSVEKTIFKPDLCTSISWPPYRCRFKGEKEAFKVDKKVMRVNRYENRMAFQRVDQVKKKLTLEKGAVTEAEMETLLKQGYEIEDREAPISRFIPDLYRKMSFQ